MPYPWELRREEMDDQIVRQALPDGWTCRICVMNNQTWCAAAWANKEDKSVHLTLCSITTQKTWSTAVYVLLSTVSNAAPRSSSTTTTKSPTRLLCLRVSCVTTAKLSRIVGSPTLLIVHSAIVHPRLSPPPPLMCRPTGTWGTGSD